MSETSVVTEFRWIEAGGGLPVLCLHGLFGASDHWERLVEAISPRCRAMALTPRSGRRTTRSRAEALRPRHSRTTHPTTRSLSTRPSSTTSTSPPGTIGFSCLQTHARRARVLDEGTGGGLRRGDERIKSV